MQTLSFAPARVFHQSMTRLFVGLCLVVLSMTLLVSGAFANELFGRVVGVSDGDTIAVLDANKQTHKIRFLGIDAPESKQAFGQVSKKALSDLVYGKEVTVSWEQQDRYGRTLGKVFVNGQDVNLQMVASGHAWHYKQYARDQNATDRNAYANAERQAQSQRLGLWRDNQPTPPWDFRRQ